MHDIKLSKQHSKAKPAGRARGDARPESPPGGRSHLRGEQQRSIETRLAILEAALSEFADKGFDGASTRAIAEKAGLHFSLITYHFGNKDMLWRATAEHFFGEIGEMWEKDAPDTSSLTAIDRIREEFKGLLRFEREHPDFHHFMVRENREKSPRFVWLMETFLSPVMRRLVPQVEQAQREGELPPGNPVLIFYLLVGIISVPSALGAEMKYNSGLTSSDLEVSDLYWRLIEQLIFKRKLYDGTNPLHEVRNQKNSR